MRKKLGELLDQYYELFGELYENLELLGEAHTVMSQHLLTQYIKDYEQLRLENEINYARRLHKLKLLNANIAPHRKALIFPNRAMRVIGKRTKKEVKAFFSEEKERALEALYDRISDDEDGGAFYYEPESDTPEGVDEYGNEDDLEVIEDVADSPDSAAAPTEIGEAEQAEPIATQEPEAGNAADEPQDEARSGDVAGASETEEKPKRSKRKPVPNEDKEKAPDADGGQLDGQMTIVDIDTTG